MIFTISSLKMQNLKSSQEQLEYLPYSPPHVEDFSSWLMVILSQTTPVPILGDFTICVDNPVTSNDHVHPLPEPQTPASGHTLDWHCPLELSVLTEMLFSCTVQ